MENKITPMDVSMFGTLIKKNTFETNRGRYTISIYNYKNHIWFHKVKGYVVVEMMDLGEVK